MVPSNYSMTGRNMRGNGLQFDVSWESVYPNGQSRQAKGILTEPFSRVGFIQAGVKRKCCVAKDWKNVRLAGGVDP